MSADLSGPINDRAMFHSDNAYYLPTFASCRIAGRTNTVSNTAFADSAAAGMMGIERVIDAVAAFFALIRCVCVAITCMRGQGANVTPINMTVEDNVLPELMDELIASLLYESGAAPSRPSTGRRGHQAGHCADAGQVWHSFTTTFLNQAVRWFTCTRMAASPQTTVA